MTASETVHVVGLALGVLGGMAMILGGITELHAAPAVVGLVLCYFTAGVCRAMPRPARRPPDGAPAECRYMAAVIVSAATPLALTPWLTHPDRAARGRGELAVTWGRA